jgi:hypothetical protein
VDNPGDNLGKVRRATVDIRGQPVDNPVDGGDAAELTSNAKESCEFSENPVSDGLWTSFRCLRPAETGRAAA